MSTPPDSLWQPEPDISMRGRAVSKSDEAELLPCPFCSATPLLQEQESHEHSDWLVKVTGLPKMIAATWSVECVSCGCGMLLDTKSEAIAAWNHRAPAMPAVKALDWENTYGYLARAASPVEIYAITEYAGMAKPFKLEGIGHHSLYFATLEAAKAAAQADYEQRVLSAIEPSALSQPVEQWRPTPAPSLERVLVAGWQRRNGRTAGYWWYSEDATDDKGAFIDYPGATLWVRLDAILPPFPASPLAQEAGR